MHAHELSVQADAHVSGKGVTNDWYLSNKVACNGYLQCLHIMIWRCETCYRLWCMSHGKTLAGVLRLC